MKISRIRISQTGLPYVGGAYVWGAPMYRVGPKNATEETLAEMQRYRADSYRQVPIKVGGDWASDIDRIPVVAEDAWGGEITTATITHFAASTPEDHLQNTADLMNYNTRSTGIGGPSVADGKHYATDTPGLGVAADFENLVAPVAEYWA